MTNYLLLFDFMHSFPKTMVLLKSCLKLCTFDVTNTLLKFKMAVGEQYAKVGHIYGIHREPDQITAAFLDHWKSMNTIFPNFGCNLGISSYVWWSKLVEKTFTVKDNELSQKQIDAISHHLYDIYKKNVCWEVVPGTISLLNNLKNENVALGVISNFDERLESVLSANDLKAYFDFILASYIVKVAKPDSRIFDLALKKSSCVSSNALHVGDNVKLDYQAAKMAGWNSVLIYNKAEQKDLPEDVNPNDVVKDIVELESHLFCAL